VEGRDWQARSRLARKDNDGKGACRRSAQDLRLRVQALLERVVLSTEAAGIWTIQTGILRVNEEPAPARVGRSPPGRAPSDSGSTSGLAQLTARSGEECAQRSKRFLALGSTSSFRAAPPLDESGVQGPP